MAVTDFQSLYAACNKVALEQVSSVQSIGGYDTFIELYNQDDIDNNWNDIQVGNYDSNNNLITKCTFGSNADQSRLTLIAGDNIEIPSGYTLTPINPRKSLVILCDKFVNNGTVSMQAKGPNILPHEYYIIGQTDGYDTNIIIPAYANNAVSFNLGRTAQNGVNGNNGVNRQCGSGGSASHTSSYGSVQPDCSYSGRTGSGYAFGGGAGCGKSHNESTAHNVDSTYPMHGTSARNPSNYPQGGPGGTGNPPGKNLNGSYWGITYNSSQAAFGVGGRIIIFCSKFENNGNITVNGTNANLNGHKGGDNRGLLDVGGASGAGAIDIFYTKLTSEGTITANGGSGMNSLPPNGRPARKSGNGGNGSITLTQYNASAFVLPGYADKKTLTKFVELVKTGLATKTGIDDTQQRANMTYSSKKIESMIPTSISDLTNDAGFLSRHITAKEVRTIWDDTEV